LFRGIGRRLYRKEGNLFKPEKYVSLQLLAKIIFTKMDHIYCRGVNKYMSDRQKIILILAGLLVLALLFAPMAAIGQPSQTAKAGNLTWSGGFLWTDGFLWSGGRFLPEGFLWSGGFLWTDGFLWSGGRFWTDGFLWSGGRFWTDGFLWSG